MMKREVFANVINTLWHRRPFRPFVIELDDGERLVVEKPEALGHYVGSATLFQPDGEMVFVDPEDDKQVLELEAMPPK
jgi:hypothetical protein